MNIEYLKTHMKHYISVIAIYVIFKGLEIFSK
jgi:hypothetical protein